MNWLMAGLKLLTKLPVEKVLVKRSDPVESINKLEQLLKTANPIPSLPMEEASSKGALGESATPVMPNGGVISKVTTEETVAYQKREMGKELLLLEKHLQQKCKIAGKACDCCEKHPLAIEALAQETLGITGDDIYHEVATWARNVMPVTTEEASRSGQYDEEYPALAVTARDMRKRLMGTEDIKALLSPELDEKVYADVQEILDRAFKKEGGNDERTKETV